MRKLKSLTAFFDEQEGIMEDNSLATIIGGIYASEEVSSNKAYTDNNGCEVMYSDTFEDCNGNGKWDAGEQGTQCWEIEC